MQYLLGRRNATGEEEWCEKAGMIFHGGFFFVRTDRNFWSLVFVKPFQEGSTNLGGWVGIWLAKGQQGVRIPSQMEILTIF